MTKPKNFIKKTEMLTFLFEYNKSKAEGEDDYKKQMRFDARARHYESLLNKSKKTK